MMLNMARLGYDKNTEYFFETNSPTGYFFSDYECRNQFLYVSLNIT